MIERDGWDGAEMFGWMANLHQEQKINRGVQRSMIERDGWDGAEMLRWMANLHQEQKISRGVQQRIIVKKERTVVKWK